MAGNPWKDHGWRTTRWALCAVALVSSAPGWLPSAPRQEVRADTSRTFELRVYHVLPGKLSALESRFRETTSRLLAKHHLNVVGYWVSEDAPASESTFIFVVAHSSREEAKKNWDEMRADPEFQEVVKSEQGQKTVERVDVTYMRPTEFSPMK
jgi:hypothetical protein